MSKTSLSSRELEIYDILVLTKFSPKVISLGLNIKEGTLRKHTERIYRKRGVKSRFELLFQYMEKMQKRINRLEKIHRRPEYIEKRRKQHHLEFLEKVNSEKVKDFLKSVDN